MKPYETKITFNTSIIVPDNTLALGGDEVGVEVRVIGNHRQTVKDVWERISDGVHDIKKEVEKG